MLRPHGLFIVPRLRTSLHVLHTTRTTEGRPRVSHDICALQERTALEQSLWIAFIRPLQRKPWPCMDCSRQLQDVNLRHVKQNEEEQGEGDSCASAAELG
jgi:hypothetical protein